jgi:hypothetical protein
LRRWISPTRSRGSSASHASRELARARPVELRRRPARTAPARALGRGSSAGGRLARLLHARTGKLARARPRELRRRPALASPAARGDELGGSRTHAPGELARARPAELRRRPALAAPVRPRRGARRLPHARAESSRARPGERCRRPNRAAPARAGGAVCAAGRARRSPHAPVELARGPDGVRHGEGTTAVEGL